MDEVYTCRSFASFLPLGSFLHDEAALIKQTPGSVVDVGEPGGAQKNAAIPSGDHHHHAMRVYYLQQGQA